MVLEYDGDIVMVYRWNQELIGYHFSVLHQPEWMTINVGALTRWVGKLTDQYVQIAALLSHNDRTCRPLAYIRDLNSVLKATKILADGPIPTVVIPILTDDVIERDVDKVMGVYRSRPTFVAEDIAPKLSSDPIMLHSTITCNITHPTVEPLTSTSGEMRKATLYQVVT